MHMWVPFRCMSSENLCSIFGRVSQTHPGVVPFRGFALKTSLTTCPHNSLFNVILLRLVTPVTAKPR